MKQYLHPLTTTLKCLDYTCGTMSNISRDTLLWHQCNLARDFYIREVLRHYGVKADSIEEIPKRRGI